MQRTRLIPLAAGGALALSVLGGFTPAQADTTSGYLSGTITDAAAHPIPGAFTEVYWCDGVNDGDEDDPEVADTEGCFGKDYAGRGYTDRNGRYVVEVSNTTIQYETRPGRTGRWLALADGYPYVASGWLTVALSPRTNTTAGNFTLAPDPVPAAPANAALTGVVTDAAGVPIPGADIDAYDSVGRYIDSTSTQSDGRYYFVVGNPADYTSPAAYAEDNVTGSVKLQFSAAGRAFEWSGDTPAKSRATAVPVAAYGSPTASAPTAALTALGSVTGTVALPAAGGNWVGYVSIYDLDGVQVDYTGTDAAGNFSVDVLPGSYYVRAEGSRYAEVSANITTCPACTVPVDYYGFVAGYYGGASSLATAKVLTVGSAASASTGTITLTNALAAVVKPEVKGKLKDGELAKGKKLTVTTGEWNRKSNVTYTYVWKVGSKVLSTTDTLKVSKKVLKKIGKKLSKLTVTVTATDVYGELVDGSSTVKVKKALAADDKGDKGDKGKGGKGGKDGKGGKGKGGKGGKN
jgi:protocatechuate 3,4-dioxygenase beta subunit